ncbi:MFS transporter [Peribacillus glennii]|uniref:MFS transporter n=1 Tax=Peribacillus glennii TaxID=2303991 RepID=UPI001F469C40|nr:MFS transporter [Peribacillus glennii]
MEILREEKKYGRLFFAGVINGIGDRFSSVAILTMLLQLTGSGFAVGLTLAIRLVPFVVFGPLGGMLADRFSRKRILIITDLSRILFALSLLVVDGKEDVWVVYVTSFVMAAGEAIYAPARKSSIIKIIENKASLLKVNSLEQVMLGVVLIGGAFSGGIVSYIFGPQFTFWFNAFSFLVAALIIANIEFPAEDKTAHNGNKEKTQLSSISKILLASVPLQIILLCQAFVACVNGIDNVLISVYAVKIYELGEIGVGMFYGALGIGLMLSFFVAKRLKKHLLLLGIACLMAEGIFVVLQSRIEVLLLAVLIFISAAFMSGIGNACFDTVLMKETPEEHQGKLFGFTEAISNTIHGGSMFMAGVATEYIHPRTMGFFGGISYIGISFCLLLALFIIRTKSISVRDVNQ